MIGIKSVEEMLDARLFVIHKIFEIGKSNVALVILVHFPHYPLSILFGKPVRGESPTAIFYLLSRSADRISSSVRVPLLSASHEENKSLLDFSRSSAMLVAVVELETFNCLDTGYQNNRLNGGHQH